MDLPYKILSNNKVHRNISVFFYSQQLYTLNTHLHNISFVDNGFTLALILLRVYICKLQNYPEVSLGIFDLFI